MKQLLALLLFVPSLCLAQLPEFVSETGLIGWYGFNNNFNDSSLGDNHGVSSGASFTSDRFGEPNAAASIEVGSFIDLGMESNMVLTPQDSITIAFWSHPNNDEGSLITKYQNLNGPGSSWYIKDGLSGGVIAFGNGTSGTPNQTGYYNLCPNATSDWTHITVVFLGSQVTIWLNGAEVCTVTMPVSSSDSQPQPVLVGRSNCPDGTNCNNNGSFAIDELGLWERALTAEEIHALFSPILSPILGCTNEQACNYDASAIEDDGSCVYPPAIDLGEDIETCEDSLILDAGEGFDYYLWNTGDTVQELITTESFTYNVSASLLGDWIWTSGEELSVSYWNSIVLNPSALCAEMYDSDGFMAESCDLEKYFVLELPDLNEPISDPALAGFTYVDPAYMAAYNAGLTTPLSSNYYLSNEQASFYAAQDICESHGGHLVAINSEAENEFVANIDGAYFGCGNDCDGFWIGLQRAICTVTDEIFVDFDDCDAYCGEGTVWDPINQECIVAIPTDTDFDGCVTAGDVLNLLATFGTCPPIPFSGPCQGQDHVTYDGYDYDIVAIGEQCWFAENLRTTNYLSGSQIPLIETTSEWMGMSTGGRRVYGLGDAQCGAEGDTIGYCNEPLASVVSDLGYLYNWHVVSQNEGVCPANWHVPNDSDFETLLASANQIEGDAFSSLKSQTGWADGKEGTNTSGFGCGTTVLGQSSGSPQLTEAGSGSGRLSLALDMNERHGGIQYWVMTGLGTT